MAVNIITLNQLIKMFDDFSLAHLQLKDFGFGDTSQISTTRNMKFPYLWTTQRNNSTINIQNKTAIPTMSLTFLIVDKIIIIENVSDENGFNSDNTQEILSDTLLIAQDLVTYISSQLGKYGVVLGDQAVTIEQVYDDTTDKVAGWLIDIDLQLRHYNCALPISYITPSPFPPSDCEVGTIKNSDDSYTSNVQSGGNIILPDITLLVNGATQGTYPSVKDIAITIPTQSCNSLKPTKTGQVISYAPNDDGAIQFGRDTDFFTLSWTNPFGNNDRFTDINGLQVYGNDIIIDWSTFDFSTSEVSAFFMTVRYSTPLYKTWDYYMINSPFTDEAGVANDWVMINMKQGTELIYWVDASHFQYFPYSYSLGNSSRILYTSTARGANPSAHCMVLTLSASIGYSSKAQLRGTILTRQFTLTELGL